MKVKIGDLGLAARVTEPGERKRTLCGTPNYIAPEILENKHGHSFEVDIWSTGVVLFTMLVGRPPYESKDVKSTYKRILANNFTFPEHVSAPPHTHGSWLTSKLCFICRRQTPHLPSLHRHELSLVRLHLHAFQVQLSEESKDLISSMLQTDPTRRPSIPTIAAHPFFTRKDAPPPKSIPQSALVTAPVFALAKAHLASVAPAEEERPRRSSQRSSGPAGASSAGASSGGASSGGQVSAGGVATRSGEDAAAVASDLLASRVTAAAAAARTRSSRDGGSPRASDSTAASGAGASSRSGGAREGTANAVAAHAPQPAPQPRRSRSTSRSRPLHASAASSAAAPASVLAEALESRPPVTLPREVSRDSDVRCVRPPRSSSRSRGSAAAVEPPKRASTVSAAPEAAGFGFAGTGLMSSSAGGGADKGCEMGTLESIHHNLAAAMAAIEKTGARPALASLASSGRRSLGAALGPRQWVTQYVDYTSKYGLGYLLSDGSTGVYFNDSTKIVLGPKGKDFQYMERVRSKEEGGGHERFEAHTLDAYPPALHKKVTLLQHFRDYLLTQQRDKEEKEGKGAKKDGDNLDAAFGAAGNPPCEPKAAWGESPDASEPLVFVKKWVRTRHAILFRMSNHTVQVMFLDNTEVLLSSEARVVTFADKAGARRTLGLAEVVDAPRSDITKRLKYTKDILRQLITSGKK